MEDWRPNGSQPLTIMKKKYYRLAKRMFPEEKDKQLIVLLARSLQKNNEKIPSKEEMGF